MNWTQFSQDERGGTEGTGGTEDSSPAAGVDSTAIFKATTGNDPPQSPGPIFTVTTGNDLKQSPLYVALCRNPPRKIWMSTAAQ